MAKKKGGTKVGNFFRKIAGLPPPPTPVYSSTPSKISVIIGNAAGTQSVSNPIDKIIATAITNKGSSGGSSGESSGGTSNIDGTYTLKSGTVVPITPETYDAVRAGKSETEIKKAALIEEKRIDTAKKLGINNAVFLSMKKEDLDEIFTKEELDSKKASDEIERVEGRFTSKEEDKLFRELGGTKAGLMSYRKKMNYLVKETGYDEGFLSGTKTIVVGQPNDKLNLDIQGLPPEEVKKTFKDWIKNPKDIPVVNVGYGIGDAAYKWGNKDKEGLKVLNEEIKAKTYKIGLDKVQTKGRIEEDLRVLAREQNRPFTGVLGALQESTRRGITKSWENNRNAEEDKMKKKGLNEEEIEKRLKQYDKDTNIRANVGSTLVRGATYIPFLGATYLGELKEKYFNKAGRKEIEETNKAYEEAGYGEVGAKIINYAPDVIGVGLIAFGVSKAARFEARATEGTKVRATFEADTAMGTSKKGKVGSAVDETGSSKNYVETLSKGEKYSPEGVSRRLTGKTLKEGDISSFVKQINERMKVVFENRFAKGVQYTDVKGKTVGTVLDKAKKTTTNYNIDNKGMMDYTVMNKRGKVIDTGRKFVPNRYDFVKQNERIIKDILIKRRNLRDKTLNIKRIKQKEAVYDLIQKSGVDKREFYKGGLKLGTTSEENIMISAAEQNLKLISAGGGKVYGLGRNKKWSPKLSKTSPEDKLILKGKKYILDKTGQDRTVMAMEELKVPRMSSKKISGMYGEGDVNIRAKAGKGLKKAYTQREVDKYNEGTRELSKREKLKKRLDEMKVEGIPEKEYKVIKVRDIPEYIENKVKVSIREAKEGIVETTRKMRKGIKETPRKTKRRAKELSETTKKKISNIKEGIKGSPGKLKEGIEELKESTRKRISRIKRDIKEANEEYVRQAYENELNDRIDYLNNLERIKKLPKNVKNNLNKNISKLREKIKDTTNKKLRNIYLDTLRFEKYLLYKANRIREIPSRTGKAFKEVGKDVKEGISGIRRNIKKSNNEYVKNAYEDELRYEQDYLNIKNRLKRIPGDIKGSLKYSKRKIMNSPRDIKEGLGYLKKEAKERVSNIKRNIKKSNNEYVKNAYEDELRYEQDYLNIKNRLKRIPGDIKGSLKYSKRKIMNSPRDIKEGLGYLKKEAKERVSNIKRNIKKSNNEYVKNAYEDELRYEKDYLNKIDGIKRNIKGIKEFPQKVLDKKIRIETKESKIRRKEYMNKMGISRGGVVRGDKKSSKEDIKLKALREEKRELKEVLKNYDKRLEKNLKEIRKYQKKLGNKVHPKKEHGETSSGQSQVLEGPQKVMQEQKFREVDIGELKLRELPKKISIRESFSEISEKAMKNMKDSQIRAEMASIASRIKAKNKLLVKAKPQQKEEVLQQIKVEQQELQRLNVIQKIKEIQRLEQRVRQVQKVQQKVAQQMKQVQKKTQLERILKKPLTIRTRMVKPPKVRPPRIKPIIFPFPEIKHKRKKEKDDDTVYTPYGFRGQQDPWYRMTGKKKYNFDVNKMLRARYGTAYT